MRPTCILVTVLASAGLCSCAKVVVVKVETPVPADGVVYALPRTVVRLQVKLDQTKRTGAKYVAYSAIFAPDGTPVCKDTRCTQEKLVSYSLQPATTVTTYGEPDPTNVYLVKFSGSGSVDQTMSMTWNEAGLLSTAGASVTNRSVDVAVSGLKLLASVGTKAGFGAALKAGGPRKPDTCKDFSSNDSWILPILRDKGGSASAQLMNTYCEMPVAKRDALPSTSADRDLLEDATKDYASKVTPLVEARTDMLRGSSMSMDPATLLPRIEAEIAQQMTALYLGSKAVQTWEGTLDVHKIDVTQPTQVLKIDAEKGFCIGEATMPPESKTIPSEFGRLKAGTECDAGKAITMQFEYYPAKTDQLFTKIVDSSSGDRSFRYRIPAQLSARLAGEDGKSYGAAVLSVGQLGTVISLPAERHTKSLSYDLGFIEATGALKSFKLGTTGGLDAATVDALSSAGGTVLDARNAKQKSEQELAVLTEQDQLLKLKDEICTIQAKYGITCTVAPK